MLKHKSYTFSIVSSVMILILINYIANCDRILSNDEIFNDHTEENGRNLLIKTNVITSQLSSQYNDTNCTTPAIENFPHVPQRFLTYKMLIIYLIISIYMFIAIAVICDEYFVPSLQVICEKLNLESDVAGATFMAAGSSAPELAAALIAVFIAKDDIGVGAVVGSAVFNIAFAISICALFAGRIIKLNWWPLTRDCFFYLISIFALFFAMYDGKVTRMESFIFILLYITYIAFMTRNRQIEKIVKRICGCKNVESEESKEFGYNEILNKDKHIESSSRDTSDAEAHLECSDRIIEKNVDDCDMNSLCSNEDESGLKKCYKMLIFPLKLIFAFTIPNCCNEKTKKWFFLTFFMSCLWISVFSYILVWMFTIIGFKLSIPDTVMGLTFIAAGVSIPDVIASLIVVREGFGDMALTNAIASNVFDILLCLGIPWFLKTAIIDPGSTVRVMSRGLEYSTLSLLSTVIFFIVITHLNGWKLNRIYGIILMIWYFLFMVFANLYELNIFGPFNPPMCSLN